MILFCKKFLFFLFIIFSWHSGNSQDLFNAGNSKRFASYLFSTQQYNLAANEFERVLILEPNDTTVFTNLLKSYRLGTICDRSFGNLERLNLNNFIKDSQVASEFLKLSLTCNCCYNERDFSIALSSLGFQEQTFFQVGRFVFREQKDSLLSIANLRRHVLQTEYPVIFTNIEDIRNFKSKKPGIAATMSAIIPGSGKAYSGYWGDAVMSMIFVASNAWISYRGFNKKGVESATGWIFGSMSVGFYLGNIWGSGKAAKSYNQIEYEKLYIEAKGNITNHF